METIRKAISTREMTRGQHALYAGLTVPEGLDLDEVGQFKNWSDGSETWEPMPKQIEPQEGMTFYIGTKSLMAKPMNLGDYNAYRGWTIPENEDPANEGYLVKYQDGYESWSPKGVFEGAYQTTGALSFGHAIEGLKEGQKLARAGWNGKGMFVYLVGSGRYKPSTAAGQEIADKQPDGLVPYVSYIAMKTVTGDVVPWLASQTDVLADDWQIIV